MNINIHTSGKKVAVRAIEERKWTGEKTVPAGTISNIAIDIDEGYGNRPDVVFLNVPTLQKVVNKAAMYGIVAQPAEADA